MRKAFIAALAFSLAVGAASARIHKHGGSGTGTLPNGVTLIQPDGGINYYGNNGFTVASASRTYNSVVYAQGLDSPGWFPIGPFNTTYGGPSDSGGAARWNTLGLNTAFAYDGNNAFSGQLNLFNTNGVAVVSAYQFLAQTTAADRAPSTETVIIELWDEPFTTLQAITAQITGLPQVNFTGSASGGLLTASALSSNNLISQFNANTFGQPIISGSSLPANTYLVGNGPSTGSAGTYGITTGGSFSGSMSQAAVTPLPMSIINGRALYTNFTSAIYSLSTPPGSGNSGVFAPDLSQPTAAVILATNHLAVDGTTNRHIDVSGIDFYWFAQAYSANGTFGGNNWNATGGAIYAPSGSLGNLSVNDMAKGSHHGDGVDFMRFIQAGNGQSAPIFDNIETGNGFLAIPYEIQPQELNWSMWSHVIHGGRGIAFFTHDNGWFNGQGGANGNDNLQSTQSTVALTATASATLSAGGTVLTVASVSSGFIAPGMVSLTGVSGTVQILQQTNNFSSGSGNVAATYATRVISGAGTGSGTMTFTQPAIQPNVGGTTVGALNNQVRYTNALISTLAPVINSPFAKGYVTSNNTGYSFELGISGQPCSNVSLQSAACATATGIDFMAKWFTGTAYSTSGYNINADAIPTNTFYIFATTRYPETAINTSVTFTVPSVSNVTVINEGRTITPAGNTFTDNFVNAWDVHIYKITP